MSADRHVRATPHGQLISLLVIVAMFGIAFPISARGVAPFPQWDKVVHAISGAALAFAFLPAVKNSRRAIWWMLAVGIIFELVEVYFVSPVAYGGMQPYLIDTAVDLAAEVIGACIFFRLIQNKRHG